MKGSKARITPSAEVLKELSGRIEYVPETGEFFMRCRVKGARWNAGDKINGTPASDGTYRCISVMGFDLMLHRVAFYFVTGSWPTDEIDHIDHNGANNRWANLRPATRRMNVQNQSMRSDNTSGYTGVTWHKRKQKWFSQVQIDGKCIGLGYFPVKEDAIIARMAANDKYGFHENHGASL